MGPGPARGVQAFPGPRHCIRSIGLRKHRPAVKAPLGYSPSKPTPTFSPQDVTVLFVLGGPGAGKG